MVGRSKSTWITEEDAKSIEVLLELHVSRKYDDVDNIFKPGYLKAVQQLIDASHPNSGLKAEPHIKFRMKTWKTHFNIVHDMVYETNTSGFSWDTDKRCVAADAELWDEYVKSHEGVAYFCDKPYPQFNSLCKIFGKDRATSKGATDLGEDVIEETQRNLNVDVEGLEDIVEEMQQTASANSKRKRPPTDDTENSYKEAAKEIKETFKEVGEKLTETIYNIGRQVNKEAFDMTDKVIKNQCHTTK